MKVYKRKVGAGHYELSVWVNDKPYRTVTTNMPLIDAMDDDDEAISSEAIEEAIKIVCNEHEIL